MRKRNQNDATGDFLAAASGILLTAAFPDMDLDGAAWLAMVPLMAALRHATGRVAFRRGVLAGMAHYLTLIYWLVHTMRVYGGLPWYLAVPPLFLLAGYLSLFFGVFGVVCVKIPRGFPALAAGAPLVWVGAEYARGFLLSGFPWELLGYSQYRRLHLIQISDIFGVYGVSFLLMAVNVAAFLLLAWRLKWRWQGHPVTARHAVVGVLAVLAAVSAAVAYGAFRVQSVDRAVASAPHLRAAVVQGNIDQMVKWNPGFQHATVEKYLALSRGVAPPADLVVWPETAVPFYFLSEEDLTPAVIRGIREARAHFVIGSPAYEQHGGGIDYFNSAYLMTPEGRPAGRYDKVHLVPFGEYVPLQEWLPFVQKLVVQAGDFKTGRMGETLAMKEPARGLPASPGGVPDDVEIGVQICYEIIFPELSRAAAAGGAEILVNVTNDAWYGRSSAPYQHFSMAVFRAVENKRSLVRAANTGISGFIDPVGRIIGRTPLFVEAAMARSVPVLAKKTVYTQAGDWFAGACLGLTVFIVSLELLLSRRKKP